MSYQIAWAEVPKLLYPYYLAGRDPLPLKERGLIHWDDGQEQWRHTEAGQRLADQIRAEHRMTWDGTIPGGGRWVVEGQPLNCGNILEILRSDGTWMPVRFEVEWSGDPTVRGGRVPVLHVGIAGGSELTCHFEEESALFRW